MDRGKDQLADWADRYFAGSFASTDDEDVVRIYADIVNWVQGHPQFTPEAKATAAGNADAWLVAFAKVKGYMVVTHETPDPFARRVVKIPSLCQAFNVPFVSPFQMLRELGVSLLDH